MSRIAIVSAMHQELRALLPALDKHRSVSFAGRTFHIGTMEGQPVVMTLSGVGKVAAAITATLLLQEIDVQRIVFTGVAGGLGPGVRVGDVVVARELLQHDMDASPLFPRWEVPLTGRARFPADADLSDALAAAALHCLQHAPERIGETHLADFGIDSPLLHQGLVVSGDRFVTTAAESATLRAALPDALAVEMEGAALAQACADFGRPFAVIRTVSDRSDDAAHVDFNRFIAEVASIYTREILACWMSGVVD
ncbi:5'-methylthioadenosine/adenosylhomocysteine nucleosidase [Piscinibacter sp.]|uniref:5'-methylthioadenosine/adenosylhomocysteine nucleosidase n=1 Tax=Piscinibacter sp. TaxID=1903157 RepID=UPI0039E5F454